jgi:UDP-N-acetylglucosamine 4,6-dehydratase
VNQLSEEGIEVPQGYEYNSGNNPQFLSINEINSFNKKALQEEQSVHQKQSEMLVA